jgi:hypothetical protein
MMMMQSFRSDFAKCVRRGVWIFGSTYGHRLVALKLLMFYFVLTSKDMLAVVPFLRRPHSFPSESYIFIKPGASFLFFTFTGLALGTYMVWGFNPPRDPKGGVSSSRNAFVNETMSATWPGKISVVASSGAVLDDDPFAFVGITIPSYRRTTFFIKAPALSSSKIFNRLNRILRNLFLGNIPETARRNISPVPCRQPYTHRIYLSLHDFPQRCNL